MEKIFILMLGLLGSYSVSAACPDITGKWVASFDTTTLGETYAGVYLLTITTTTINASGYETLLGDKSYFKTGGGYTVNSSCKISFTPGGTNTEWTGFIVNPDEMLFIGSDSVFQYSFKAVAKRMSAAG